MLANLIIFLAGFIVGAVILAIIKKQKQNRRFNIENQMLRDQAEILRLQKKVSEIESEKKQLQNYLDTSRQKSSSIQNLAS